MPNPPAFRNLFDGSDTGKWRMTTARDQPGRDEPARFEVVDGAFEAVPGRDIGLWWHTDPTPPDFLLSVEWLMTGPTDNSGVFVRFPDPQSKGYDNAAWAAVDFGFEIQIDNLGRPDGDPVHLTAAVYEMAAPADPARSPDGRCGPSSSSSSSHACRSIAPSKGRFLKTNWWQAVFLAFPFLRIFRVLRAARLARAGRLVSSSLRAGRTAAGALTSRIGWLVGLTLSSCSLPRRRC